MIDKQLLKKRFSRQADDYDQYAQVQKKMARHLMGMVMQWPPFRTPRILEIGCGTGYLTELLLRHFPLSEIDAVDLAPGMVAKLQNRLGGLPRVQCICGDIEEMTLHDSYDLIISNAAFQWFNDLENTLEKLKQSLRGDGQLLFSTFGERTFHELHASFSAVLVGTDMDRYRAGQRFLSLSNLMARCTSPGCMPFSVRAEKQMLTEYFPTARQFLRSVQKIGANNSNTEQSLQRPTVFRRMLQHYDQFYRTEKGIPATYEALYISFQQDGTLDSGQK